MPRSTARVRAALRRWQDPMRLKHARVLFAMDAVAHCLDLNRDTRKLGEAIALLMHLGYPKPRNTSDRTPRE